MQRDGQDVAGRTRVLQGETAPSSLFGGLGPYAGNTRSPALYAADARITKRSPVGSRSRSTWTGRDPLEGRKNKADPAGGGSPPALTRFLLRSANIITF